MIYVLCVNKKYHLFNVVYFLSSQFLIFKIVDLYHTIDFMHVIELIGVCHA